MTTIAGLDYDVLLSTSTEQLIYEYRRTLTDREVIQAVARARIHVRNGFSRMNIDPPPPDEYVSLVLGLARQDIKRNLAP